MYFYKLHLKANLILSLAMLVVNVGVSRQAYAQMHKFAESKINLEIEEFLYSSQTTQAQKDFDLINQIHENVHLVNAKIREHYVPHPGKNGIMYDLLRFVVLREPTIKLTEVAAAVPPSFRGDHYQHYLKDNLGWQHSPLFIFDEWSAYLIAAEQAVKITNENPNHVLRNVAQGLVEIQGYATALTILTKKKNQYSKPLGNLYKRFSQRTTRILKILKPKSGLVTLKNKQHYKKLVRWAELSSLLSVK